MSDDKNAKLDELMSDLELVLQVKIGNYLDENKAAMDEVGLHVSNVALFIGSSVASVLYNLAMQHPVASERMKADPESMLDKLGEYVQMSFDKKTALICDPVKFKEITIEEDAVIAANGVPKKE